MLSARVLLFSWAFASLALGVVVAFEDGASAIAVAVPALSTAAALCIVSRWLLTYRRETVPHVKAREADGWIHTIYEYRIERLTQREKDLSESIAELRERFEEEKAALQEIREERIAAERMFGFRLGLERYPEIYAHHQNPKNRLRVVRSGDEESA